VKKKTSSKLKYFQPIKNQASEFTSQIMSLMPCPST
jgi:hypothetical protein